MKNKSFVIIAGFRPAGRPGHRAGLRHEEVRPDGIRHPRPEDRRGLERRRGQPEAAQGARRPAVDHRLAHQRARRPVQGGRRQDRRGQDPHQGQPRPDRHRQEQRRQVRLRQRRAQPRGQGRPRRVRPEAHHREQGRLHRDPGPHRQHRLRRDQPGPRPEAGRSRHDVPLQAAPHPAAPHVRRQPGQLHARRRQRITRRPQPEQAGRDPRLRISQTQNTDRGDMYPGYVSPLQLRLTIT